MSWFLLIDSTRDTTKLHFKKLIFRWLMAAEFKTVQAHLLDGSARRATEAIERGGLAVEQMALATSSCISLICLSILGMTIAWWIPFVLLAGIFPSLFIRDKVNQLSYKTEEAYVKQHQSVAHLERLMLDDHLAKDVRLLRLGQWIFGRWLSASNVYVSSVNSNRKTGFRKLWLLAIISALTAGVCVVYAGWQAFNGFLSPGGFAIILGIVSQIQGALGSAIFSLGRLRETSSSMSEVGTFLAQAEQTESQKTESEPTITGFNPIDSIELHNVKFNYAPDCLALNDVSLSIKRGSTVALVGENGSGKSTLVNLICGLYRPADGSIFVNGQALTVENAASYCDRIGVVFQDFAKFPVSLGWNVALGNIQRPTDISMIEKCLAAVRFPLPPGGLDAIDESSFQMALAASGGEWQRLALARAMYRGKDTDVLIMDEPTGAMDPLAEHLLLEQMLELAKDKIALFVTHRMTLAKDADIIVVLHQGSIVEMGSHLELMQREGHYAAMYRTQASRFDSYLPLAKV